jgi:hypothetical protein
MPKKVKENKLHKGELTVQHSGPVCILKCSVKKNVAVISPWCRCPDHNKGEERKLEVYV